MELLTIAEIAKQTGIAESTLRSWRDKYADYVPSSGSGRKKRYPDGAIQVFRTIAELAAEGLTAERIAERVGLEYPRFIELRSENSSSSAAMIKPVQGLEVYGMNKTIQQMAATLDLLVKQLDENNRLRQDIDRLEQRIQELEQEKTPWYKRMGKK